MTDYKGMLTLRDLMGHTKGHVKQIRDEYDRVWLNETVLSWSPSLDTKGELNPETD